MQVTALRWTADRRWEGVPAGPDRVDLVLFFGGREAMTDGRRYRELREMFPDAALLGCSTGGQIQEDDISDDVVFATAFRFKATGVKLARAAVSGADQTRAAGGEIGRALAADDLAGVFVLSDGLRVNGSDLVAGISAEIGNAVLTGGLAGDGPRFEETVVSANHPPEPGIVGAVGFYGPAIRISWGSAGGWDVFGPRRRITRSNGHVLYELDGEPALDLYERYLGEEESKELPGSALLFPLRIRDPEQPDREIVRTILGVDPETRSMTFAGNVPEGWTAQLMRGNFDRLVEGAGEAAYQAVSSLTGESRGDRLALLVSCIGRRLLMGQHTLDEMEATRSALGDGVHCAGFYSYGEISPHAASGMCELHNQTMTVTTLYEAAA